MADGKELVFRHGDFALAFAADTGACVRLAFRDETLLAGGTGAGFALKVSGWTPPAPRLVSSSQKAIAGGSRIRLEYLVDGGAGPEGQPHLYRVWQVFDLLGERIERRLSIQRQDAGKTADQFISATLFVDGMTAGDPERTKVSVPMARMLPATPLKTMLRRPRVFQKDPTGEDYGFASAPDIFIGAVTVEREEPPLHIAVMSLPRECPVQLRLYGREGRLVVGHEFVCESWVASGASLDVAAQVLHVQPQRWQSAVPTLGAYLAEHGYAPPTGRPDWIRNAIIYEAEPGFCGGFLKLIGRLDELQRIGFNTVYLMPWHRGGYGTIDYEQVEPSFGSFTDLRRLCDEAHRRGMHVLFDLLVNIATDRSPYMAAHPDWFYRDAQGKVLRHPTWGGNCFDPASPGFRRFFIDYAVRCCTQWAADGFRVDAAAYRGGLWNNLPGLQPHQHAHAVFTLLAEAREAVRAQNPSAIFMAECFGPQQTPISDLVCFQWIAWLDWALDYALSGRISGAALQRIIGEHFLSMPQGTWFNVYTHTHDTLAFEKRDLEGPPVSALFATLSLLACGTMVFSGGWGMHARPRPEEVDEYKAIFAAKSVLGGVSGHEVRFPPTDDPALMVAERPSAQGPVRLLTNFSPDARPLAAPGARLYSRLGSPPGKIAAWDTIVFQKA